MDRLGAFAPLVLRSAETYGTARVLLVSVVARGPTKVHAALSYAALSY
jgi:hypothetical protein